MAAQKIFYIAAHGGAGHHSRASEGQVKDAMKRACTEALRMASESPSPTALAIVERAITLLEDDDCMNAGYGSNLTLDGAVECDAALMDGHTGDFGSVGAVPGVTHPIMLAGAILRHARVPDRIGRLRPLTLVSSGAHAFARGHGIETVDPACMISPRARQDWARWRARYDADGAGTDTDTTFPRDAPMQDTVGAIAWDADGHLAAGVSSGGILLKYAGRVGEAATFGAGCWAEESQDGREGMACSISGAGEHIVRTGLARTIADVLRRRDSHDGTVVDVHDVLTRTLSTRFHDPIVARDDTHADAGVVLMTKEVQASEDVIPRLWCAFTTDSMSVAYANSERRVPKAKILRRPKVSQSTFGTNTSPVYITALPIHELE